MARAQLQADKRLRGTWRSDRRKTFQYYPDKSVSQAKLRKFKALFGKMVVRWGRTKYHSELNGQRWSTPFEIVASDDSSVVIRSHDSILDADALTQIHFEGDYYWVAVDGRLVEWFRRVKLPST